MENEGGTKSAIIEITNGGQVLVDDISLKRWPYADVEPGQPVTMVHALNMDNILFRVEPR